jgi:hypothetical protein
MGSLLFILVHYFFPMCFSAEAQLNSTPTIPISLKTRVSLDIPKTDPAKQKEPFQFEFQIKNVSGKTVLLNMWFADPEVATLGPKELVNTKKINVVRGKRRPPNESDILRLAPGETKSIVQKHWAFETFPYFTRIKDQPPNSDDSLAYVLKGQGSYAVTFCWTFTSMSNPFLKTGEAFWQGQVCSPESKFEVKFALPKSDD